jgi:hypothetical protein
MSVSVCLSVSVCRSVSLSASLSNESIRFFFFRRNDPALLGISEPHDEDYDRLMASIRGQLPRSALTTQSVVESWAHAVFNWVPDMGGLQVSNQALFDSTKEHISRCAQQAAKRSDVDVLDVDLTV